MGENKAASKPLLGALIYSAMLLAVIFYVAREAFIAFSRLMTTGFRKSNLLEMRCSQVDLRNNTVCLYAGETKNEEPLIVGLTTQCRELLT